MCFEKLQEIVKCTTWNISCYEFISKGMTAKTGEIYCYYAVFEKIIMKTSGKLSTTS